jgi:thiamine biosynthesis lipoprotein
MSGSATSTISERRFAAMGSDAHLVVVGGAPDAIDTAVRRVDDLERRWSRFIDTSEVSELNRRAGHPVLVSPETVLLVRRAVEAWRITGGGFDPTVLGAVIRAGYDTTFEAIENTGRQFAPRSPLVIGCTDIVVDEDTVSLPRGTGFDPGGIGKGLAADLVLAELLDAGVEGACVNLGGDLRVTGRSPTGPGWTIAVEHPEWKQPVAMIGLSRGAVATSTTLKRRWKIDGEARHHLIDPGTGEPSTTDVALCTVIAGEAWIAEVIAKAALLRGTDRAFDIVDESDVHCLIVGRDGAVQTTAGFTAFAGGPAGDHPACVRTACLDTA